MQGRLMPRRENPLMVFFRNRCRPFSRCIALASYLAVSAGALDTQAALNVLPLGDSLTFGSGELTGGNALVSNDNNLGYRRFLQEML